MFQLCTSQCKQYSRCPYTPAPFMCSRSPVLQIFVRSYNGYRARFWRRRYACCTGFRGFLDAPRNSKSRCCWKVRSRVSIPFFYNVLKVTYRDVTDHLQLLLRKAGHHLHTTAEFEVVRTIKEKSCYIALNPQKEEKESANRPEDFKLPDGNTIQVSNYASVAPSKHSHITLYSWVQSGSELQKSSSTQNLSVKNMPAFIKSS